VCKTSPKTPSKPSTTRLAQEQKLPGNSVFFQGVPITHEAPEANALSN
jgi:hypothetical protein